MRNLIFVCWYNVLRCLSSCASDTQRKTQSTEAQVIMLLFYLISLSSSVPLFIHTHRFRMHFLYLYAHVIIKLTKNSFLIIILIKFQLFLNDSKSLFFVFLYIKFSLLTHSVHEISSILQFKCMRGDCSVFTGTQDNLHSITFQHTFFFRF